MIRCPGNGFGGKPEPCDVSFLASAARELHEESGLLVNNLSCMSTRGVLFLKSGEAVAHGIEIWVYTVDVADCTGEIIEWVLSFSAVKTLYLFVAGLRRWRRGGLRSMRCRMR